MEMKINWNEVEGYYGIHLGVGDKFLLTYFFGRNLNRCGVALEYFGFESGTLGRIERGRGEEDKKFSEFGKELKRWLEERARRDN